MISSVIRVFEGRIGTREVREDTTIEMRKFDVSRNPNL